MDLKRAVEVLNERSFRDCATWKISSLPAVGPFPEEPYVAKEHGEGERITTACAIAVAEKYEREEAQAKGAE